MEGIQTAQSEPTLALALDRMEKLSAITRELLGSAELARSHLCGAQPESPMDGKTPPPGAALEKMHRLLSEIENNVRETGQKLGVLHRVFGITPPNVPSLQRVR